MPQKQLNYSDLANKTINKINPITNLPSGTTITDKTSNIIDPSSAKSTIDYTALKKQSKKTSSLLKPIAAPGFELDKYGLVPEVRLHQGQDVVDRIRANNQRWYTQLGNFLGQVVIGEIVGGVISGVGAIGEIPDMIRDGFSGSGHVDFNNAILRAGNNVSEWARESMPVYEQNPNESWQMDDFGWWMGNGVSIASTLSLMIPGLGVVKGIGWLASFLRCRVRYCGRRNCDW